MNRVNLAAMFSLLTAVMYVITDDTTFGIWMIVSSVISYGTHILEKLDEKADE